MAREGTRSATGSSTPRVFQQVDTAPTINRKPATKKAGSKPTGVTKKVAAPKKESSVAKKVKAVIKKGEAKVKKATTKKNETKTKTPKTKKAAVAK
ncbi:putative histone transcription regulator [Diaporthe ampelina]|uniref:Putative histone transcription regulator n=1 Tax=Diaporthe ampelina TaxID=1214573 RepID=A0A0G2HKR3_9PEZI|nr:putative histone transcription regulator [Diaporthe ampelina]